MENFYGNAGQTVDFTLIILLNRPEILYREMIKAPSQFSDAGCKQHALGSWISETFT